MKRIAARCSPAFTLVELMVSLAVIAILVGILASVANESSRVWLRTTAKVDQFRETRAAFEAMTTRLSQATLNTYWDYNQPVDPQYYERRSELRFISGPASTLLDAAPSATPSAASNGPERSTHCVFFQAPLGETETEKYEGFENLLCTWGFYLEWGDDTRFRPPFLTTQLVPNRYRPRLMELRQPGDSPNSIYGFTSGLDSAKKRRALLYKGREWFRNGLESSQPPVRMVAENVIALVITPRLAKVDEAAIKGSKGNPDASPLAPAYLYDSSPSNVGYTDGRLNPKAQLPPVLQVTMVAIDETSAMRLNLSAKQPDPFGLKKKFQNTADYSRDLFQSADSKSLEATLIARQANYRIFNTNVIIRGARWSREQLQ